MFLHGISPKSVPFAVSLTFGTLMGAQTYLICSWPGLVVQVITEGQHQPKAGTGKKKKRKVGFFLSGADR